MLRQLKQKFRRKSKAAFETTALGKLSEEQLAQIALTSEEQRDARIQATREVYGKSILFDYSYKFFYEDGYGKESLILNLNPEEDKKMSVGMSILPRVCSAFISNNIYSIRIKKN